MRSVKIEIFLVIISGNLSRNA